MGTGKLRDSLAESKIGFLLTIHGAFSVFTSFRYSSLLTKDLNLLEDWKEQNPQAKITGEEGHGQGPRIRKMVLNVTPFPVIFYQPC
jgi:hypothetical protein